jgi:hypothetical protein
MLSEPLLYMVVTSVNHAQYPLKLFLKVEALSMKLFSYT